MRPIATLATYGAGLAAVFGLALGAGQLADVAPKPGDDNEHVMGSANTDSNDSGHGDSGGAHADGESDEGHSDHGTDEGEPANPVPAGLQIAADGYRFELLGDQPAVGAATELPFRIVGPDGKPVTDYTLTHDKKLHLIVVRRDFAGYQHVHPTMAPDGTWTVPLRFAEPGTYRLFADFDPAGKDAGLTLGADLTIAGALEPTPLPEPTTTATVDGYEVSLDGTLVPGEQSKVSLTVRRDGEPVTDLEPYLGAYGHLVSLRAGDLAYLHVHPDGAPGDGRTQPGPSIEFYAEVPSSGAYRLFLDFQHGGVVRTAEFTATTPDAAVPDEAQDQAKDPSKESEHGEDEGNHGHND